MSDQRTSFPVTSSQLRNPHQAHDEAEQATNCHDEAIRATDGSFASQTSSSSHVIHNSSNATTDKLQDIAHVSQGDEGFSKGLSSDVILMEKNPLHEIDHIASSIAIDPDLVLSSANFNSSILRAVSIDPPVTESSLAELNLERIGLDPKLRHDLNFDRDVSFRPNYEGQRGYIKKTLARQYWAVLAVELGYYMRIASGLNAEEIQDTLNARGMSWRLRHMFQTIRAILLTLVQRKDAEAVRQVLDIDFLMQQLDHGMCDLIGLGEWLGNIIKSSCSPVRDPAATEIVDRTREAVEMRSPVRLAGAIELLFSILETMKLDVANHQIRGLRLKMIADTVRFSREYFAQHLMHRDCLEHSMAWFSQYRRACHEHAPSSLPDLSGIEVLARATIDIVVRSTTHIPQTFVFDYDRICEHHLAFQALRAREAIVDTLQTLRTMIYPSESRLLSPAISQNLFQRLAQLDPGFSRTLFSETLPEDILIEIVCAAYESLGHSNATNLADRIELAHDLLSSRLNTEHPYGSQISDNVCAQLEDLALQEVGRMITMDEIEMHNYSESVTKPAAFSGLFGMSTGRGEIRHASQANKHDSTCLGDGGYRILAVKVAHIAVLHWRVWGPTLYEHRLAEDEDGGVIDHSEQGDDKAGDTSEEHNFETSCEADSRRSSHHDQLDLDPGDGTAAAGDSP